MTRTDERHNSASLWGSTDCLGAIQHGLGGVAVAVGPDSADFRGGDEVAGYRLVRRLGEGSQAEVWEALDDDGGSVAIRLLRPEIAEAPGQRAAFLRSAELTREFRGGSQLPTIDAGESSGVAYQVIPLVRGANLAEAIAARRGESSAEGPPDPSAWWIRLRPADYRRAVAGALAGVARALEEAHGRGVAHRDIKPSNVLLDRERPGRALLSDFGLGSGTGGAACGAWLSGTLMYMAPERLLGLPSDLVRCDIFALGVTLYEALTLAPPRALPGGTHRALVPAHLAAARAARPREVCPELSRRIESVILRAIAPDPADRYGRAGTLADDLELAARLL